MSEENQDTEMEDILSSIKNILEEDQQSQANSTATPVAEPDVLGDVLNASAEVDDILELSQDMRLSEIEDVAAETVTAEETGLEVDPLDEIASAQVEEVDSLLSDEPLTSTEEALSPLNIEDDTSDSFFEEISTVPAPEPLEEVASEPVNGAEPFFEPISEVEAEPANESEPFFEPEPKPEAEVEPESAIEPEPEPSPEPEAIIEPEADIVAEPEAELEPEVMAEPEPIIEPEPEPEPDPEPKTEKTTDNVVDVSANIISNFAKMFSHEEPVAQVEPVSAPITSAGNVGKTLEEFVLEAITKVIGQEIKTQWNNGAEYQAFAEAEIIRQTKEWINDNLPMLVEKVVKQEIERVIAKVGS